MAFIKATDKRINPRVQLKLYAQELTKEVVRQVLLGQIRGTGEGCSTAAGIIGQGTEAGEEALSKGYRSLP